MSAPYEMVSKQPQLVVVQGQPMPAAAASSDSLQTGHFSSGILSCCENCFPSCITSCCCPCFAYARVRSIAKLGGYKCSLFLFSTVMFLYSIFKMFAHAGMRGMDHHHGHHDHGMEGMHGQKVKLMDGADGEDTMAPQDDYYNMYTNGTSTSMSFTGQPHKMKCCLFATAAVFMFLIMNLMICQLRSGFRRTFEIKNESCCEDTAFSCLCPHLALAQMMRHTNPNPNPGCCDCSPNGSAVTDAPVATAILISGPVATNPLVSLV